MSHQTLVQAGAVCLLLPLTLVLLRGLAGWIMLGALSLSLPLLLSVGWSLRRFGSARAVSQILLAYGVALVGGSIAVCGGLGSAATMWVCILPISTAPRLGPKVAIGLGVGTITALAALCVAQAEGLVLESAVRPGLEPLVSLVALIGVSGLLYKIGGNYERDRSEVAHTVAAAHRASELIDAEILKAAHAKEDLIANISHDVHSPMVAIVGFSEVLVEEAGASSERGTADLTVREALCAIQRNSQRLLRVIDHLLDLSRLDSGRFELVAEHFAPEPLLSQIAERARADAAEKGIDLALDIRTGGRVRLHTDPRHVAQIVRNLVQNAIEFTEAGQVRISMEEVGAEVRIEVSDTGIGIPPELLERLFLPFEQADNSLTREHGGAGLGLAICARLARALGAELRAESTIGEGSRFVLCLPRCDAESDAGAPAARAEGPKPWALPPNWVRADDDVELSGSALVVSSAPDTRRFLAYILRKSGLSVETAEDPLATLACVNATVDRDLDAILVDMAMLGGEGAPLIRKLRDRRYRGPIIVLQPAETDPREPPPAGCTVCLELPLARHALIRAVASALAASGSARAEP